MPDRVVQLDKLLYEVEELLRSVVRLVEDLVLLLVHLFPVEVGNWFHFLGVLVVNGVDGVFEWLEYSLVKPCLPVSVLCELFDD